jgi:hypothetical protein
MNDQLNGEDDPRTRLARELGALKARHEYVTGRLVEALLLFGRDDAGTCFCDREHVEDGHTIRCNVARAALARAAEKV